MNLKIVLLLVLIITLIIFVPIIAIWAVNVLFGIGIALSLKTWFAMLCLIAIFGTGNKNSD